MTTKTEDEQRGVIVARRVGFKVVQPLYTVESFRSVPSFVIDNEQKRFHNCSRYQAQSIALSPVLFRETDAPVWTAMAAPTASQMLP